MNIAEQLSDVQGLYSISKAWPLAPQTVEAHQLQQAFHKLIEKTSHLRTIFHENDQGALCKTIVDISYSSLPKKPFLRSLWTADF